GYTACIVDTDPQCNATDSFGVDRDELSKAGRYTVADIYLAKKPASEAAIGFGSRFGGKLTLVPGHRGLVSVSHRLDSQLQAAISGEDSSDLDADDLKNEHRQRLKNSLDSLRGLCDVVFIDTPPDLGFLMTTALIGADYFIIPVFPSGYDLKGLETLMRTVEKVQKRFNPRLRLLGVLLGNYDAVAKLDSDIHKMLSRKFGGNLIFDTTINRSVKHREATVYGQTIFEHAQGQQAANQFQTLTREVVARLEAEQGSAPAPSAEPDFQVSNRG
ncbi:MAG TPA: ParA family protein, partial [Bryobacteraceae bacterium]|nr:ParA family protein [Bryobacteraceae bacterium]